MIFLAKLRAGKTSQHFAKASASPDYRNNTRMLVWVKHMNCFRDNIHIWKSAKVRLQSCVLLTYFSHPTHHPMYASARSMPTISSCLKKFQTFQRDAVSLLNSVSAAQRKNACLVFAVSAKICRCFISWWIRCLMKFCRRSSHGIPGPCMKKVKRWKSLKKVLSQMQ